MRLWFCFGTAGELIKLYPVLRAADERGLDWRALATGQSPINMVRQWKDFNLPSERLATVLETAADLKTSGAALAWFARANAWTANGLRAHIRAAAGVNPAADDAMVVHGDTLSTVVGARYGRLLGLPVAHVEAGLRSSSLLSPFPEEINRRWVSRVARWHFTQDARARGNLERERVTGAVIDTGANTLIDALHRVLREPGGAAGGGEPLPPTPFAVANIHRFENLGSERRWTLIVDTLTRAARARPVYLVLHPPTEGKLAADPAARRELEAAGVRLLPRQPFTRFIRLAHAADFLISDGGSNQEECHYMGKPCLILRDRTERFEGLPTADGSGGGSCVLSRFDLGVIDAFLKNPAAHARPPVAPAESPSEIIVRCLERDLRKPDAHAGVA